MLNFTGKNDATIGCWIAMPCKVDFGGLAIAKFDEEGYVYVGISAGVACLVEGSLEAVLAPVDGDSTGFNDPYQRQCC